MVGRSGKIRARPACESIAGAGGVAQRNLIAFDGVFIRIRPGRCAACEIVTDGVPDGTPACFQRDVTHGTGGNPAVKTIIIFRRSRHSPTHKFITLAGRMGDIDPVVLDGVAGKVKVVRSIRSAVHHISDVVLLRFPTRVQRHIAFHPVGIKVDLIFLQAGRRAVPAGEFVAVARRRSGGILIRRLSYIFDRPLELILRTIIPHIVQVG